MVNDSEERFRKKRLNDAGRRFLAEMAEVFVPFESRWPPAGALLAGLKKFADQHRHTLLYLNLLTVEMRTSSDGCSINLSSSIREETTVQRPFLTIEARGIERPTRFMQNLKRSEDLTEELTIYAVDNFPEVAVDFKPIAVGAIEYLEESVLGFEKPFFEVRNVDGMVADFIATFPTADSMAYTLQFDFREIVADQLSLDQAKFELLN